MNYRHAFHAGNFADVMKHALLARILTHLNAKDAPYHYIDTHAGIGIYDLADTAAARTGEWRDGIGRLVEATLSSAEAALFAPYLDCVMGLRHQGATLYPGSPEIARRLMRAQDCLTLAELHPDDAQSLRHNLASDTRVHIQAIDGWLALKAKLPPKERRGLVLIDPPFEETDEFTRMIRALETAQRKWATGIYGFWYPIKDLARRQNFIEALKDTGIRKMLRLELRIAAASAVPKLIGSGLILVNPPWKLADEARIMLGALARVLGQTADASAEIDWISGE